MGGIPNGIQLQKIHRKSAAHGNADMLSRLWQPVAEADAQVSSSTTNPEDHAVCFVGASGVWPRRIPSPAFNVFIEASFKTEVRRGCAPQCPRLLP